MIIIAVHGGRKTQFKVDLDFANNFHGDLINHGIAN